jgi:MHS family proline/betaine transporter-like MFS transporter
VPFLLAGPLGLIGLYIRLRLEETPAFRALGDRVLVRRGLREILRTQLRSLLLCVALVVVFNVPDFIVLSYMPSYLAGTLHVAESRALLLSVLVLLVMMATIPWAGALSDRVGRRPMIAGCCVLFLVLSVPCFVAIRTGTSIGIFGGMLVLGLALTGFIGTMPATLPALFPTEIRYGALAIAYNISISLFGATSLPINAWLVQVTGDALVPAYYLMGTSAIGIVAVWFLRESAGQALPGSPALVGAGRAGTVTKASPIA